MEKVDLKFNIKGKDFINAGLASSSMKKALIKVGVNPIAIKKASIAMYEAEINTVIHANEGVAEVSIYKDHIKIVLEDKGPGIEDIDLAMKAGFSTAPEMAREMGFGAGMGLPNIKKNSDFMKLESTVGKGTRIQIVVNF